MILLSITVVPFFWRAKVYTAYEYLERRFDLKTRTLTALLFLISRGLSCGVIVAAPAVILSIVLGWNLTVTVLAIGVPTVIYTMLGGVQAVTWTDVKQMGIIVGGILAAVVVLIARLPDGVTLGSALHVAGAVGRTQALDFRFDVQRDLHVLVGADRRPVPGALVLRLRPEPGPALPDGPIGQRGPPVALRERVRQDSAAGAHPPDRRPHVRLLPLLRSGRCSSTRRAGPGAAERAGRRVRRRSSRSTRRRSRRGGRRAARLAATRRPTRRARQAFPATDAGRRGRPLAGRVARQGRDGRRDLDRRELRLSRRSSSMTCPSAWSA